MCQHCDKKSVANDIWEITAPKKVFSGILLHFGLGLGLDWLKHGRIISGNKLLHNIIFSSSSSDSGNEVTPGDELPPAGDASDDNKCYSLINSRWMPWCQVILVALKGVMPCETKFLLLVKPHSISITANYTPSSAIWHLQLVTICPNSTKKR